MATYFVGCELDAFVASNGTLESTGASISGLSRGSIIVKDINNITAYFIDPVTGADATPTEFWTHYIRQSRAVTPNTPLEKWLKSDGTAVLRFFALTGNFSSKLQMNISGTWTDLPGLVSVWGNDVNQNYDIYCKIASSGGIIRLYIDNILIAEYLGNTSFLTGISNFNIEWQSGSSPCYFQQMLVASYNTIGHIIRRRTPTGNSAVNTAWTGDYTGVDELPNSDTDVISSGTAAQKETFTAAALPATAVGSLIKAVAVASRIRRDVAGPQNAKAMLRIGSTDYAAAYNLRNVGTGFNGAGAIWDVDPSTGVAWVSITNVNGEFGVQSVA